MKLKISDHSTTFTLKGSLGSDSWFAECLILGADLYQNEASWAIMDREVGWARHCMEIREEMLTLASQLLGAEDVDPNDIKLFMRDTVKRAHRA